MMGNRCIIYISWGGEGRKGREGGEGKG